MPRPPVIASIVLACGALLAGCTSGAPAKGQTSSNAVFVLSTHCGIDDLQVEGAWYERAGGKLDDGQGNPPPGWDNPVQRGSVQRVGERIVFTDSAGHREEFVPRPAATGRKRECA